MSDMEYDYGFEYDSAGKPDQSEIEQLQRELDKMEAARIKGEKTDRIMGIVCLVAALIVLLILIIVLLNSPC